MSQLLFSFLLLFSFQTVAEVKESQIELKKNICLGEHSNSRKKFVGGDGSEDKPYVICNIYQLQKINNNRSAHYVLGQNIDVSLSHPNFTPIGKFSGELNGNGFEIQNLQVQDSFSHSIGLFQVISSGGRIKNLGIKNPTIHLKRNKEITVGGLAGKIEVNDEDSVMITNSYVSGSMTLVGNNNSVSSLGGLIGEIIIDGQKKLPPYIKGPVQIRHSYVSGSVAFSSKDNSASNVGKLVGSVEIGGELEIMDSYVEVDTAFHSEENFTEKGGLVGRIFVYGRNGRFEIKNCSVRGQVNFFSKGNEVPRMGGLAGSIRLFTNGAIEITDSYIEADTIFHIEEEHSHSRMGGLAGEIFNHSGDLEIRNFSIRGQMNFSSNGNEKSLMGGLAGRLHIGKEGRGKIIHSRIEEPMIFFGENNSEIEMGGLVGQLSVKGPVKIIDSDVNDAIIFSMENHSRSIMGGLIGSMDYKEDRHGINFSVHRGGGDMKIIDSDVNGAMTFFGRNNIHPRMGGLFGVMIPEIQYMNRRAKKSRVTIENSYVRNDNNNSPLMNLFYDDQNKCVDSEWLNIHNTTERYRLIVSDEILDSSSCLPIEFDLW